MDARRGPGPAECNYVLDLRERQAEPTSLTDEREQPQHVGWIAPVAGRPTARRGKDVSPLVQPQRLSTQAAARCHLTDKQPVPLHEDRVGPIPRGTVKCPFRVRSGAGPGV